MVIEKIYNIMNMPSNRWKKVVSNYSKKILTFDSNNIKKKSVIDKILVK